MDFMIGIVLGLLVGCFIGFVLMGVVAYGSIKYEYSDGYYAGYEDGYERGSNGEQKKI